MFHAVYISKFAKLGVSLGWELGFYYTYAIFLYFNSPMKN